MSVRSLVHVRQVGELTPPALDDWDRYCCVSGINNKRSTVVVVRRADGCARTQILGGGAEVYIHPILIIQNSPVNWNVVRQQAVQQAVGFPHTEVLVGGVHGDD